MKSIAAFTFTLVIFVVGSWPLTSVPANGQQQPSIYKEPVDPSKLPQGKFRKGNPKAISGEYIVILRKSTSGEQVKAFAQELVGRLGITVINADKPHGFWITGLKGFAVRVPEAVAQIISQDPRVDHVTENVTISIPPSLSPTPTPNGSPTPSSASAPFKLIEENGYVYKAPANIYKEQVDPSRLPQEKFRHGNPRAIPGEYIVILQRDTMADKVEAIAQELANTYGITIQTVWKLGNKGFSAKMSERAARAISQDVRVDHVTENVRFSQVNVSEQPP